LPTAFCFVLHGHDDSMITLTQSSIVENMIIYEPKKVNREAFVDFWSQRYQYTQEHLYNDNIGLPATSDRVLNLFVWKNGTPLSALKLQSVRQNYVQRIEELLSIPPNENALEFLERFSDPDYFRSVRVCVGRFAGRMNRTCVRIRCMKKGKLFDSTLSHYSFVP
jgi:hypothetical protein